MSSLAPPPGALAPVSGDEGRRAATAIVLATSPFALRYGTEARMHSLVMLLVLLGWLAVRDALDEPGTCEAVVGALSGLRPPQGLVADDESLEHGSLFRDAAP